MATRPAAAAARPARRSPGTSRSSGGGRGTRFATRTSTCSATVVDEQRAWRRWLPPVLFFMALAATLLALARPRGDGGGTPGEGERHPHHRQLGLDVREGRAADAPGRRAGSRAPLPRQASRLGTGSASSPSRRKPQVVAPLTLDRQVVRDASRLSLSGTRHGDRRRSRQVRRAGARRHRRSTGADVRRAGGAADDDPERPVTAILMLSDGAQTAGILQPFEGAQKARAPEHTRLHGGARHAGGHGDVRTGTASSRTILGAARPGDARADRRRHGGRVLRGRQGARLNQVYERLGSQIGRYDTEARGDERAGGGGAVLLLGAGLLAGLWFPRIP